MGLFDSIKKTAINKIVNTVEKSIGKAVGSAARSGSVNSGSYNAPQNTDSDRSSYAQSRGNTPDPDIEQKFEQILTGDFPELRIMKNAAPANIGITAPQPCRPYTFALMRNGKAAVVILLTQHNRINNAAFKNARKSALDSKIPFLNFYTHMPNERGYITSRIKSVL